MSAAEDREFVLQVARHLDAVEAKGYDDFAPDSGERLRRIAERIVNPTVEVVEQGTLMRKGPGAPDGWSWDDIGPFTGYYSGVRLQKGEPVVEQDGHLLFVRQGEVSFAERQIDIYTKLSQVYLPLAAPPATKPGHDADVQVVLHAVSHYLDVSSDSPTEQQWGELRTLRALRRLEQRAEDLDSLRMAATVLVVHGFKGNRTGYTLFVDGEQRPTRMGGAALITEYVAGWLEWSHANPIIPRKQPKRPPQQEKIA